MSTYSKAKITSTMKSSYPGCKVIKAGKVYEIDQSRVVKVIDKREEQDINKYSQTSSRLVKGVISELDTPNVKLILFTMPKYSKTTKDKKKAIGQLIDIVKHFYDQDLFIGDIKPENIVFDGTDIILIDLYFYDESEIDTEISATPEYLASYHHSCEHISAYQLATTIFKYITGKKLKTGEILGIPIYTDGWKELLERKSKTMKVERLGQLISKMIEDDSNKETVFSLEPFFERRFD